MSIFRFQNCFVSVFFLSIAVVVCVEVNGQSLGYCFYIIKTVNFCLFVCLFQGWLNVILSNNMVFEAVSNSTIIISSFLSAETNPRLCHQYGDLSSAD